MSRERQSEAVRRKVVATARRLFVEKGYEETTIRQISAAAGVSSGSIYHFFADKEGIFLDVVLEVFELTQDAADSVTTRPQDPYLRLALKWSGLVRLVSADRRVAELFAVAYHSWKITDVLLRAATERHQAMFASQLPDWDSNRFFAFSLVLKGVLSSLVDERLHLDRLSEAERIRMLLATVLPAVGADGEQVRKLTQKVLALLLKQDVAIAALR